MINETNQLSEREREILRLVASGLSNQQIANQLGISINTVKVHLRNVFGKIGVASRTEATLYALRSGIVVVEGDAPPPTLVPVDDSAPLIETTSSTAEPSSDPLVAPIAPPAETVAPVVALDPADALQPLPVSQEREQAAKEIVAAPVIPARRGASRLIRGALLVAGVLIVGALMVVSAQALGWIEVRALPIVNGPVDQPSAPPATIDETTRWQELPELPSPRAAFAVANLSDQIYVIGGENQDGVLASVERYDVGFESWASLSDKPTPVTDARAVVLGEKLYVPGGRSSTDAGDVVVAFERYDPRTESWETLPDLPQPRSAYALATAEGKLYLFGGWDGTSYRREVFEYDPSREEWRERTAMSTARAYSDAAVVDAGIYVLGGENETGRLATNELYFPSREGEQPWVRRPPMPAARSRFGAVGVSSPSIIYVIGGDQATEPLQYNADTDRWQPLAAPAQPIGSLLGVVQQDTTIVTLGGKLDETTYSATMQRYQALYTLPLVAP